MHTFFINTSTNEFGNYSEILEIQQETRKLVSLKCPLPDWEKEGEGYKSCAHRIGELIDSYKDINNNYNLIIYIDFLAFDTYSNISVDQHLERYACVKALNSVLKHYIRNTLVSELISDGRIPNEVLLIYEENKETKDKDEFTQHGKETVSGYVKELLGIKDAGIFEKQVSDALNKGTSLEKCFHPFLGNGITKSYKEQIDIFREELEGDNSSEKALNNLTERIVNDCSKEDDRAVYSISFITDRKAGEKNKQKKTRRDLRLCIYLLSCVEGESVFVNGKSRESDDLTLRTFTDIDWETAVAEFAAKGSIYKSKYDALRQLNDRFSKIKMAPTLYKLNGKMFNLDEFGKPEKTYEDTDTYKAERKKKKEKKQQDKQTENEDDNSETPDIPELGSPHVVEVKKSVAKGLFDEKEFSYFGYKDDNKEFVISPDDPTEKIVQRAIDLRRHHIEYIDRFKAHVTDVLSNYSGRSRENDPALLKKRRVSIFNEDFEDFSKEYRYVKQPDAEEESRPLKTVENVSNTAYESTLNAFLEFCVNNSLAVTDIREQCDWFVSRIHQIKDSLKKLNVIKIGMLIATLALYLPYLFIEWSSILRSGLTVVISLLSIGIPVALLLIIIRILVRKQRDRLVEAWDEYKEKSDEVLNNNAHAAETFDRLLTVYIPSLRWVYEYKLDVDFYADCCRTARAKINHHVAKINERIVTVNNIIEDLEEKKPSSDEIHERVKTYSNPEIDCNVSFCSGAVNRDFYSIIDQHFLAAVNK